MFNFSKEQKVLEIRGVKIGGQPGQYPTVMLGTIFYKGQFKTVNAEAKARTEEYLNRLSELWDTTGLPGLADIFIDTDEDIRPRLEAVLEPLDWNLPFSIDIPESETRIKALQYLGDQGLLDRVIYNSLNLGLTDEEKEALKMNRPAAAILLGYNPKDYTTDGRLKILRDGDVYLDKGLIPIARECGIENLMLDTAATPFGNGAGENIRALPVFKNTLGYPAGLAIHNTVGSWKWLSENGGEEMFDLCDAAANGILPFFGADWMIYGPIENGPKAFPPVAMADIFVSEAVDDYFAIAPEDRHPRGLMP